MRIEETRWGRPVSPASVAVTTAALILVVFAGTLACGFVWDDHFQIADNPFIRSFRLVPIQFISDLWTTSASEEPSGYYRPLQNLSYTVDWALWGAKPTGFHGTGILLHAICTLLTWALARRIGLSERAAFWTAVFAAVHPTRSEPLAFLGARGDLLSTMLLLASALLAFDAFDRDRPCKKRFVTAMVCVAAAALSKPWAILWPLALAIVPWWTARGHRAPIRTMAVTAVSAYVATSAAFVIPALLIPQPLHEGIGTASLAIVAARVPDIVGLYLRKTLWPVNQSAFYDIRLPEGLWAWSSLIWALALAVPALAAAFGLARRRPWAFWAAMFFLMTTPLAGLIRYSSVVADRYFYPLALPICALGGLAVDGSWTLGRRARAAGMLIAAALVLVMGMATIRRVGFFTDDVTLMADAAAKSPKRAGAVSAYATALNAAGRPAESLTLLDAADPSIREHPSLALRRAEALRSLGERERAWDVYKNVLRVDPKNSGALDGVAEMLLEKRDYDTAQKWLDLAVRARDRDTRALFNRALAFMALERWSEAEAVLRTRLRWTPYSPGANAAMGDVLERMGRLEDARKHWRRSLWVNPDQGASREKLKGK